MQFDKTRIIVRERSYLDIMDLALWVVRDHAWPLLVTLFLGAVPAAALNIWLLGGDMIDVLVGEGLTDESSEVMGTFFGFLFLNCMLVVFEIPLATSLMTLYLGSALFEERPQARQLAREFLRSLPQLVLFQVIVRGLLIPWVITWFVLFAIWPYLNEVILLERNPLRRRGQGMSTISRSSALHGANSGELFGRWLMSLLVGGFWILALWMSIWFLRSRLTNQVEFDWAMYTIYLQLAIWLVVGYFTVVRYLSYLDLRIKSEGWEVELRMRAEAARLSRQWI